MPVIKCAKCGVTIPGPGYAPMQEPAVCEPCYRVLWPEQALTVASKVFGDGRPWTTRHTQIACRILCQAATDAARTGDMELMSKIIASTRSDLNELAFTAAAQSGLLGTQSLTGLSPTDHLYRVRAEADWTEFERGPDGRRLIAQYQASRMRCVKCAIESSCFPIDPSDQMMHHGILYWEGDLIPGGDECDQCHKKVGMTHGDASDVLGYAFDNDEAEIHTKECVECFEERFKHALQQFKNSRYVTEITGDDFELGKGFTCTSCKREVTA